MLELLHSRLPSIAAFFSGRPFWIWISALAAAAAGCLALKLIRQLIIRRLIHPRQKGWPPGAAAAARLVEGTGLLFLGSLSFWLSALFFGLPADLRRLIGELALLALFWQLGLWCSLMISFFWEQYFRSADDSAGRRSLINLASLISKILLWTILGLLILSNFGVNITALITGLGIGGVALALAVQRVLGDFLAYVSIVLDRTFEVGDFIVVGDFKGTVEHVGVRSTRVRSLSGGRLIFPNSDLLNSRIQNFKSLRERRVVFTLGVTYQTPVEKLQAIPAMLREIIEAEAKTRFDRAHFKGFGDSALVFEVVYFVLDAEYLVYMDIQQAVNLSLCRRFAEQKIEVAYPTQTIFVGTAPSLGRAAGAG